MRRHLTALLSGVLLVGALTLVGAATTAGPVAAGADDFPDVSSNHPFLGHITWMSEEGITTGYVDGTFRPSTPVTRAAMAAFLYRLEGPSMFVPPPTASFPDVGTGHPFFAEVEWLRAEGITEGFADGTFRPGAATSRGAMAAYLFRFAGVAPLDPPTTSATFTDVSLGHPFSSEVEWLAAREISTGFVDGTYRPAQPVTRQSMSAFIFRISHLAPELDLSEDDFVTGLNVAWDLGWTPDGHMLFTQRSGALRVTDAAGGLGTLLADASSPDMDDLAGPPSTETGLMGLVVDPDFEDNRTFFTCQGEDQENGGDPIDNVQVVEWTVNVDFTAVTRGDDLIDLAPWNGQNGRHAGCRLRFGADGHLWISAGDTACGTYPQNRNALAGKILRVDEDTGEPAAGNPFLGDGNPATSDFVYTYGHRNPQGLALRPGTTQMWSVEHGPGVDDEVNRLVAGGNYGWNPVINGNPCPNYDEDVPMTDLVEFPNARPAAWDTGGPTIATSGGTFLDGDSWGGWEGGMLVAALNGRQARVLFFTESGVLIEERMVEELRNTYGRLRAPQMGPQEDLFLTTDDRILRISATP